MSRRSQIEMDAEERRAFLAMQKTMILTSNGRGGYPHPMPMWFALDEDDTIWMTTFRKSQKIRNLQRDQKVSLLAESGTEYQELRGVVIYAEVEMIDEVESVIDVMHRITVGSHLPLPGSQQKAQLREGLRPTAEKRVALRMVPQRFVSWDHRKLGGRY